jgi:NAD(P)H-dependent FMN reductase
LLFALAEDNGKVSAALKNAYDWASFALDGNSPIKGKPAAVMAVSAAQAIKHFHNVVQYCKLNMMKKDL